MKREIAPIDRSRLTALPDGVAAHKGNQRVRRSAYMVQLTGWKQPQRVVLLHLNTALPGHTIQGTGLHQLAFGNPALYRGKGCVYIEPGNPWSDAGQEPTELFDCHTLSFGTEVGLVVGDWIEGRCTDLVFDTNPAEILFSAYTKPVKGLGYSRAEAAGYDHNPALRENDIVSFVLFGKHYGIQHLHSGRIKRHSGENMVLSKVGNGRVCINPIDELLGEYPQATAVHVYRLRSSLFTNP